MVEGRTIGIARMLPFIDRLVASPGFLRQARIRVWEAVPYDAAIIFGDRGRSPYPDAYICYLAGIPVRAGLSSEFGGGVLSHWIKPLPESDTIDRYLALVSSIGFPSAGRCLEMRVPGRVGSDVDEMVRGLGLGSEKSLVSVRCVGALGREISNLLSGERRREPVPTPRRGDCHLLVGLKTGVVAAAAGGKRMAVVGALAARSALTITDDAATAYVAEALGAPVLFISRNRSPEGHGSPRAAYATVNGKGTVCGDESPAAIVELALRRLAGGPVADPPEACRGAPGRDGAVRRAQATLRPFRSVGTSVAPPAWSCDRRNMKELRILTWHVHGSYLYYLARCPHQFYLPVKPGKPEGYGGKAAGFPWPGHVHEVEAEEVRDLELDCVIFQSARNYMEDQYDILSEEQRRLPRIYLEHDPPREHPTDTRHIVDDPDVLLVHVTHFNRLMWDNGRTPTRVIEHGVVVPDNVFYTGEIARGLVAVNGLRRRNRRVGADIFDEVRARVPLELIGMQSEEAGGRGEVGHAELPRFVSHFRFFFNPIRYTSLGLAVCEAMMVGMPVIGMATTEMVRTVQNGVSGYVDTDVDRLVGHMQDLLRDPEKARALGAGARRFAEEHFAIGRFSADWDAALRSAVDRTATRRMETEEALQQEKMARW